MSAAAQSHSLAQAGDVDENGDVVDEVIFDRLRRRVRVEECGGVELDEQLRLVAAAVARTVRAATAPRPSGGGWHPGGLR